MEIRTRDGFCTRFSTFGLLEGNGCSTRVIQSDRRHPVTGWWRYHRDSDVVKRKSRYSLIVSISTDDTSVDLYTMVANEIRTRIDMQAKQVTAENTTES